MAPLATRCFVLRHSDFIISFVILDFGIRHSPSGE
jgi:hypothetical protein